MKNLFAILFLVILGTLMYTLTIRGVFGNPEINTIREQLQGDTKPMELSPERGRFAHVLALGEYGSYELPKVLAEFVYPDVGYYKDKFYSFFAPGTAYLATPFYLFGKQYGLSQVFAFALVSLFSIGALIFMYLIAREVLKLPRWAALSAPILFAFGSSAWSYAITLYQHHLTVFFFLAGFYAAFRYGQNTRFSWVWGLIPWISYAAAFTVDYPNILFLLPMMVYFFSRAWSVKHESGLFRIGFRPSFLLVSLGFIAITAWHLDFNNSNFGGWQKLAGGLPSYKKLKVLVEASGGITNIVASSTAATTTTINAVTTTATAITDISTTVSTSVALSSTTTLALASTGTAGSFTIDVELPKEKNVIGFFSEKRLPFGAYTLLFSTERGLLVFWPLIILAIAGFYYAFKKHKYKAEIFTLLGGVIANMFLYFSWGDPWGGWAFGPRYLILSISILSLFAAYWMATGSIYRRISVFVLFAYSSFVALMGALTTNAVPPKIEAVPLGADHTLFRNVGFFLEGKSGSFFFNTYANLYVSLQEYGLLIYFMLLLILAFLVFILPKFEYEN